LPILTPVIIIGGIIGGIFTPTEAASVAVVYGIIIAMFVYKDLSFKKLREIIFQALVTTSTVTFIMATASAFAWLLAIDGLPMKLAEFVSSINMPAWVFLILFNVIFLILGMFMEALSILIIMVPVVMPMFQHFGLDPIHMGVVMVLNLMIGLITPPVGMSLFVTSKVANVKLEKLCKAIIPWTIPLIVVLIIITYVPNIVTWLPNLVFGVSSK